jgi:hypothetical protein
VFDFLETVGNWDRGLLVLPVSAPGPYKTKGWSLPLPVFKFCFCELRTCLLVRVLDCSIPEDMRGQKGCLSW